MCVARMQGTIKLLSPQLKLCGGKIKWAHGTHVNNYTESESRTAVSDSLRPHGLYSSSNSQRPEYWSG